METTSLTKPKVTNEHIMAIWVRHKANPQDATRNALVENYLPVVRYQAERMKIKLPDEVCVDDLMSAGVFGLIDAIKSFDLGRKIKFETYSAPRIRGAILDELRAMDWVPRLVRSRGTKVGEATRQLSVELGRVPNDEEVAKRMKIPLVEFYKVAKDSVAVGVVSLSRKWFETDSNKDVCEIDVLEDKNMSKPGDAPANADLKSFLLRGMSRTEKLIITLYYYERMTMKEIGATLDLSESRVSQMHSSILDRLRATITKEQLADLNLTRELRPPEPGSTPGD